jgi:hydrogenase maturation protease
VVPAVANLGPLALVMDRVRSEKSDPTLTGAPAASIAVIGCGNPNRSDDGIGPTIVRALAKRGVASDVRLLDAGTDGMAVIFAARGCDTLIVVDACRSGAPAGAIFEVPGDELNRQYAPSLTMHDFRWNHALHAGRMIFRDAFPVDIIVLLVEAQSLNFGLELSGPVAASVSSVTERIEDLIRMRRHGRGAP